MTSNFWRHFAISALKISKKHLATFDFFVKMKLVSTVWVSTSLSKSGYCPVLREGARKLAYWKNKNLCIVNGPPAHFIPSNHCSALTFCIYSHFRRLQAIPYPQAWAYLVPTHGSVTQPIHTVFTREYTVMLDNRGAGMKLLQVRPNFFLFFSLL